MVYLSNIKSITRRRINYLNRFFHTKRKTENPQNRIVLLSTFLLIIIGVYFFSVFHNDFEEFNAAQMRSTLGYAFITITTTLFAYKALFFIYTAYNYFKYKPVASVKDDELPTCTVIVPAYNEGKQVWDTLMSLAWISR